MMLEDQSKAAIHPGLTEYDTRLAKHFVTNAFITVLSSTAGMRNVLPKKDGLRKWEVTIYTEADMFLSLAR